MGERTKATTMTRIWGAFTVDPGGLGKEVQRPGRGPEDGKGRGTAVRKAHGRS